MFISRRDFFASAFSKAVNHIPKINPTPVQKFLGIVSEPLSAEEAAFALVNSRRKSSSKNLSPINSTNLIQQKQI